MHEGLDEALRAQGMADDGADVGAAAGAAEEGAVSDVADGEVAEWRVEGLEGAEGVCDVAEERAQCVADDVGVFAVCDLATNVSERDWLGLVVVGGPGGDDELGGALEIADGFRHVGEQVRRGAVDEAAEGPIGLVLDVDLVCHAAFHVGRCRRGGGLGRTAWAPGRRTLHAKTCEVARFEPCCTSVSKSTQKCPSGISFMLSMGKNSRTAFVSRTRPTNVVFFFSSNITVSESIAVVVWSRQCGVEVFFSMRLCTTRGGRNTADTFRLVRMQRRAYTAEEVEEIILKHAKHDGNIEHLCVDYEGEYVPVCHRDEARLLAVLVSLYHNNSCGCKEQVFRAAVTRPISVAFCSLPCARFAQKNAPKGMRDTVTQLYARMHGCHDDTHKWLAGDSAISVEQLCVLGVYCNSGIIWHDSRDRETAVVVSVEPEQESAEEVAWLEEVPAAPPAQQGEQDVETLLKELEYLTTTCEQKTTGDCTE